jgi:hypothetical protein
MPARSPKSPGSVVVFHRLMFVVQASQLSPGSASMRKRQSELWGSDRQLCALCCVQASQALPPGLGPTGLRWASKGTTQPQT